MSIVNIALQNVALERTQSTEEVEKVLTSCSGIQDIRKKENIKQSWDQSLTEVKDVMQTRLSRCILKEKPFLLLAPALDEDIDKVWQTVTEIDPSVEKTKLQKQHLQGKRRYQDFKKEHCRERQYTFQVI